MFPKYCMGYFRRKVNKCFYIYKTIIVFLLKLCLKNILHCLTKRGRRPVNVHETLCHAAFARIYVGD